MISVDFDAVSNRGRWEEVFELYDDAAEALVAIEEGDEVVFVLRRDGAVVIEARRSTGAVTTDGVGLLQVTITEEQMRSLCPGQYAVGMTFEREGIVSQLVVGTVPVVDGVVS
ncbi:hypothetical protein [Xanthobacter sp. VNH20]|uniref:hypothetical protein n=1 Tax=Xanthobacter sp. VNH20 TaxID=3156616 RepID=UPI0032B46B46